MCQKIELRKPPGCMSLQYPHQIAHRRSTLTKFAITHRSHPSHPHPKGRAHQAREIANPEKVSAMGAASEMA